MARYGIAFEKTMKHEGFYSMDGIDRGGETYRGISRRFHPLWEGWKIIAEAQRDKRNFPSNVVDNEELSAMVRNFYYNFYWNRFQGDEIVHQNIAEELFDTSVNMGVHRAVGFLQRAINILAMRRGYTTRDAVSEDGVLGPETLTALNELPPKSVPVVYKMMNIFQANHYLDYINRDNNQARFLMGWLNRVEVKKV
jgi:lysozyme family protein